MHKTNFDQQKAELYEAKLYPIGYYFDLHVTAAQLIRWVASANEYRKDGGSVSLLSNIGWHVLPHMVNCKNRKARIKSLDRYWNEIFGYEKYEHNRKFLADIGRDFLQSYEKVNEAPEYIKALTRSC